MNSCEHCGPVSGPVVEHDGVTWCRDCAYANGIEMPKIKRRLKLKPPATFPDLVKAELASAREKHGSVHSLHEGFAILLEEVDEFKLEVWKKQSKRSYDKALRELIQVGAMAQKVAEDILMDS